MLLEVGMVYLGNRRMGSLEPRSRWFGCGKRRRLRYNRAAWVMGLKR